MIAKRWAFGRSSSFSSSRPNGQTRRNQNSSTRSCDSSAIKKWISFLPGAMRDNNVDMWIHMVQSGNRDPLALDLGGWFEYRVWERYGYHIFTDRAPLSNSSKAPKTGSVSALIRASLGCGVRK